MLAQIASLMQNSGMFDLDGLCKIPSCEIFLFYYFSKAFFKWGYMLLVRTLVRAVC